MKTCVLFVIGFFLVINASLAQTFFLSNLAKAEISEKFLFLADSTQTLKLKEVFIGDIKNRFRSVDTKSWKEQIPVYWLRFSVKNDTNFDQEWILDFENWSLVDFYFKDAGHFRLKKTGHLYPYRKRDYPVANKNYIKLPIKEGETKECLVRLEYRLNLSKSPQNLHFRIAPRAVVDKSDSSSAKVIFAFLGIFAVMFLYNLFIFIVSRQKSYAYYLVVLFFVFFSTAGNSGYIFSLLSFIDTFPIWASKSDVFDSSSASISYLLFVQALLNTKERYPSWDRFLNILVVANIVPCILFFVSPELAFLLLFIIAFLVLFFLVGIGIRGVKDKYPSAVFFLLGYISNVIGAFCLLFVAIGIIPKNDYTFNYAFPFGLTIEIILFSFALANMINVLRKDNEAKQKKNIDQLLENQQLQTKVNRELEQKVKERTTELDHSLNQLRVTQDQLILKEKLASLGELTAGIAHEIQNPLNFVNNFSELSIDLVQELKEEVAKVDIDKDLIGDLVNDLTTNQQKINHHGQRASNIVRGMLEHSRTGTGERRLTSLNNLVNEYLNIAYEGYRAKDKSFSIEMIIDFDSTLQEIEIVPQDMGRVLLNLYNNAFYATQEKAKRLGKDYQPKLWVSTHITNKRVELRIKDNGTGVPKEVINKIFQPFFTTKATGEGIGLGLSISYDIITKGHNGEIVVESDEKDCTVFVIRLPI